MIKSIIFTVVCALVATIPSSAQVLTLEECYDLARMNYPTIAKLDLIAKSTEYEIQNTNRRYLPQLNFSGQATYQSQTVSFADALGSLPNGMALPSISKDQYRIQGEVSQLLYDGGITRNQKDLITMGKELEKQKLETNLYAIKTRINNIFFSILLMEAQLKQNELNKANLQTQIKKTEAALANGVAFRSNLSELEAEILNIEMAGTEFTSNRSAYLTMLSLFIDKDLPPTTHLVIPESNLVQTTIKRPELKSFDLQKSIYKVQREALKSSYLPQINAFLQGAFGRPTLNIVENKFGPWYITGIRFNWSLGSLYILSNKKSDLMLSQRSVEADREAFLLNTNLDLIQQNQQVEKFRKLLIQDEEAIALRESITKSAEAQLHYGVITVHEYIQKVNTEHLAKQTKILHEIQLLQAQYNQKFITGNL